MCAAIAEKALKLKVDETIEPIICRDTCRRCGVEDYCSSLTPCVCVTAAV